jgi:hypothetical protein
LIGWNALKHQATGGEDQFLGERDIAQFVRPVLFRHHGIPRLDRVNERCATLCGRPQFAVQG